LRLSTDLLPDQVRVLGTDHPGTLGTRLNIAAWTGQSGDAATALRLLTELLPDYERVLGPIIQTRGQSEISWHCSRKRPAISKARDIDVRCHDVSA
jgi:hypothetical protein